MSSKRSLFALLGERQIRIYHPHPALSLATARCAGQGEGTVESAARLMPWSTYHGGTLAVYNQW